MPETWAQSLDREDPLEKGSTPLFWPGEFHGLFSTRGCKELGTIERLSLSLKFCSYFFPLSSLDCICFYTVILQQQTPLTSSLFQKNCMFLNGVHDALFANCQKMSSLCCLCHSLQNVTSPSQYTWFYLLFSAVSSSSFASFFTVNSICESSGPVTPGSNQKHNSESLHCLFMTVLQWF